MDMQAKESGGTFTGRFYKTRKEEKADAKRRREAALVRGIKKAHRRHRAKLAKASRRKNRDQ